MGLLGVNRDSCNCGVSDESAIGLASAGLYNCQFRRGIVSGSFAVSAFVDATENARITNTSRAKIS